jgi:ABC-type cobalamin/Fe3+-siderophores transport system ATPase subunit
MITFHDATIAYPGAARPAVDGVSLEALPGRLTAIVGPNGSGKTTLVRALLGRLPLARGTVRVAGLDAGTGARRDIARRVAIVTQREEAVFPLRVDDYVALGRHPHRGAWGPPGPDDQRAIATALAAADAVPLAGRRTDSLSGGEWQRVRLARAIAQDTEAIVLDEPTTFLDVAHEMACFELLIALARRNTTVLVVSHQLNLVARFADHVVLLSDGRVAAAGTPDEVMRGDVLEGVYHWPLVVTRDPAVGAPMLVPLRRPASPRT